MDSTVNKTEYWSKSNPIGKPWWARQTAKASGPYHPIMYIDLKKKTLKCIEMTPKYSPILWWPKKISTKSSYPPKIFIFLRTPKDIEIQNFEPQENDTTLRMYENIRVLPPPHPPGSEQLIRVILSSLFLWRCEGGLGIGITLP